MEATSDIKEITIIKNAESLSAEKEIDRAGKDVFKLKEKSLPKISIKIEDAKPAADPKTANVFPHKLAAVSFLLRTKEPNAPKINKTIALKKRFNDVNNSNIIIKLVCY